MTHRQIDGWMDGWMDGQMDTQYDDNLYPPSQMKMEDCSLFLEVQLQ